MGLLTQGKTTLKLTKQQIDAIVYECRQSGDDSTYTIVNKAIELALASAVETCREIGVKHHAEEGTYAAGKKAGAFECADALSN